MTAPEAIARLEAHVFRVPVARPVETSFGTMRDRPAVFVRAIAGDGAFGWGEAFANWPAAGAEHRARLLIEDVAELVLGREVRDPSAFSRDLGQRLRVRAIQSGEWGPFRQVVAALDTALCDLAARRAELPLARWLDPAARTGVPAYASGISIRAAEAEIAAARAAGFAAFKVKIGFDPERDVAALKHLSAGLGAGGRLFTDANQAWSVGEAGAFLARVKALPIGWLEEPVTADQPAEAWKELAGLSTIPLAAGENIAGAAAFDAAISAGYLAVVQPDVAKWGGVSGCLRVARKTLAAGALYCPHFLGGGIGLLASAHLLAASGGDGLLEYDVNPNPLREAFDGVEVEGGRLEIGEAPGLGIDALPAALSRYRTLEIARDARG